MVAGLLPAMLYGQTQTVRSITLHGNTSLTRSEILSAMMLTEGAPLSRQLLAQDETAIVSIYRNSGFLLMAIDSTVVHMNDTAESAEIEFYLQEGKPAIIQSFTFIGNASLGSEALQSAMESAAGSRFRQAQLEQDVQAILRSYEQAGYPFAKVAIHDLKLIEGDEEYTVDITFRIDEGAIVQISEIIVEGNTTTKADFIRREARLQPSETFTPDMALRIQRRLQRTQLFSSVALPVLFVRDDGTAGFSVKVTEGNPNRFDGVAGYVPSSRAGESGYFTGLASVQFRNLFGTGRKLAARWQRESQSTQEIELRYHEPWVASYPVNVDGAFFQRKQDSTYVRRMYNLDAEYMLTEDFRVGVSFAQQDVVPSEGLAGLAVAESHTTTIGGYLFYDARDDAVTPTDGLMYRMDYHTGRKKRTLAQVASSGSTQRFGLDFEYYLPAFSRQVVATSVHAREFRAGGLDLSDLYRIGGATTVRGYREGQFIGSRVAWSNIEYRFLVSPRSFLYLFTDIAYISSPELVASGVVATEQTKIGYGAGLRLDTALGLIGVSLALGEGDTFSTAKLHLRLENEF